MKKVNLLVRAICLITNPNFTKWCNNTVWKAKILGYAIWHLLRWIYEFILLYILWFFRCFLVYVSHIVQRNVLLYYNERIVQYLVFFWGSSNAYRAEKIGYIAQNYRDKRTPILCIIKHIGYWSSILLLSIWTQFHLNNFCCVLEKNLLKV